VLGSGLDLEAMAAAGLAIELMLCQRRGNDVVIASRQAVEGRGARGRRAVGGSGQAVVLGEAGVIEIAGHADQHLDLGVEVSQLLSKMGAPRKADDAYRCAVGDLVQCVEQLCLDRGTVALMGPEREVAAIGQWLQELAGSREIGDVRVFIVQGELHGHWLAWRGVARGPASDLPGAAVAFHIDVPAGWCLLGCLAVPGAHQAGIANIGFV